MKRLLLILAGLMSLMLSAQAASLSELLSHIKQMQADFVQTVYDNKGKSIQVSRGEMAMMRPGRFRWEVKQPIPQVIVANQASLWIYDPDLEQVTIKPMKNVTGEAPALLLSQNQAELEKYFTIKSLPSTFAQGEWFQLKPKAKEGVFTVIQLGFNQQQLTEMRLQDNLGHTTRIQYHQIKMNQTISPSVFRFVPPPKTDIIDERRG